MSAVASLEKKTIHMSSLKNTKETSAAENNTESNAEAVVNYIPENLKTHCYTCDSEVFGSNVFHHLYFGVLECKNCNFKIINCKRFADLYQSNEIACKYNINGKHAYKWSNAADDYLSYFMLKELSIERFCSNQNGQPSTDDVFYAVGQYIIKLSILENHQPWKLGFDCCRKNPKITRAFSKSNKGKNSKVIDNKSELQLTDDSKSTSDKSCDNCNAPQQDELISKTKNNDKDCILARKLVSEPSKTVVDKMHKNKGNLDNDNQIQITRPFSKPKSADLVRSEDNLTLPNVSINNNGESVKSGMTDSSKENTSLSQGKKISYHSVSDYSLELSERELSYHDLDDPDEELLQNFGIEKLDQAVEYVTVDDINEKGITQISEVQKSSVNRDEGQESNNPFAKRKSSNNEVDAVKRTSKVLKKCCKSHKNESSFMDFKPPDKIPGDHYLVIHYPSQGCPEECPNCYCEFCPSMLTVNCSTYVSTIICADCKLTIYVLPD